MADDLAGPIGHWPHRRRPPRPKPFLGPLTIAGLLLYTGITVLADRLDWWFTSPEVFLSGALVIVGSALLVSAIRGRARGLILLGATLLPLTWLVAAADLTWWDGIGEQTTVVTTAADLDAAYHWGVGEFVVDLSQLDLEGDHRSVEIGLTVGELVVWVPDSMEADIHLDGRLGSLIVDDGGERTNNDGSKVTLDRTIGDPTGGTLTLDIEVGLGEATVRQCGERSLPCP
ncbi:MAG: hypothetical protein R2695_15255 [Acidimicrobiales bacterium]